MGIQWPIGRRVRGRTKVKWGAGNRPVRWIGAADNKRALWIAAEVIELPGLAAEEIVSAIEAPPAVAHPVAPARLAAAPEAAPGQAVRAAVLAWAGVV